MNGLDTAFPYPHSTDGVLFDDDKGTADDTPTARLYSHMDYYSVDVSFTMWLMYDPVTASGSIPVPIRKIDWYWEAQASSAGINNWTLDSEDFADDPPDQDAVGDFPEWTTRFDPEAGLTWEADD